MIDQEKLNNAVYAGGCFWCTESDLRKVSGVIDVVSGYTGGQSDNPSYENHTGHREAVKVVYDANLTTFKKMTQFFLDHIDPTDAGGQFFDRGSAYTTAIYYKNEEEKTAAENLIKELEDSKLYDKPISVKVLPEMPFYNAEDYHQNYSSKNPSHYYAYKDGSGRTEFQAKVCTIRDQKDIHWKD
ncbi:MAG: peptide-methionine (S)-S-oxide reductase MsrA [bacterium]